VISDQTTQLGDVMTLMTGTVILGEPGQLFRPVKADLTEANWEATSGAWSRRDAVQQIALAVSCETSARAAVQSIIDR
jgi:hypothetical protein